MKYFNNLYVLTDEIRVFFNRNLSNGFGFFVFLFFTQKESREIYSFVIKSVDEVMFCQ